MASIDQRTPTEVPPDVTTLANDNAAFAFDLYKQLSSAEGNLAFSPYSVSAVLDLLLAGASKDTATQIAHVLHCSLPPDRVHHAAASLAGVLQEIASRGEVRLSSANALFPHEQYPILPGFLAVAREYHGVSVTPLDYGQPEKARESINLWVEERTEKRITNLIPEGAIETLTRLVLANAVYFKGNWSSQFDSANTREAPFWLRAGKSVEVPTMWQREHFMLAQTDSMKVLELPYRDKDLSMLLILPNARDGLTEIETELSPSSLAEWIDKLVYNEVDVRLPRFRVEWGTSLNAVLQSMGMVDAFDQRRADFSRIDGRASWLYVALVVHKAFVEANEQGTEAAAATAVAMMFSKSLSEPREPLKFHADHPFLFALAERRTGSILFLGRVVDPRADKGAKAPVQRKGLARWFPWIGG